MIVIDAYLQVPAERHHDVEQRARNYATQVRQEPGNISFEVATDGNGAFFFWEKFQDEEAVTRHKTTDHFKIWREFYEDFFLDRAVTTLKIVS